MIGLSAAIELRGKGLNVIIVAKDLPDDTESVGFASPWAVSILSQRLPWLTYRDVIGTLSNLMRILVKLGGIAQRSNV